MQLLERYSNFWPVIAGTLVFLALSWWLYARGEHAMEHSAKDLGWIRAYRKEGWPLRSEVLSFRTPRWWVLLLLGLFAAAVALVYRAVSGQIYLEDYAALLQTRYTVLSTLLAALGAVAAACLLQTLFDETLVTVLGSLLFSVSSLCSHPALCLLTGSVWLLVLYLRREEPALKGELLYWGALLLFVLTLSIQPQNFWLVLAFFALHLYKNIWLLQNNRQSAGLLWGKLGLALVAVCLCLVAGVVWRFVMVQNFSPRLLLKVLRPKLLRVALRSTWSMAKAGFAQKLMRSRLLYPMMDAPLLGLGFFGAISALRMVLRRRNVRGAVALTVLGLLALAWLLNGKYLVTLGLLLTGGCLLKNCVVGKKTQMAVILGALGVVWYLAMYILAPVLPLADVLILRLS